MFFDILAWIGDDRDGTKKTDIGKPSLVVSEKVFSSQEILSRPVIMSYSAFGIGDRDKYVTGK
jgi:hypothetical protein